MKVMQQRTARQKGAVSLFIVIFTMLLVTTITISFMQLMMKDQQQATYADLSESAYDSAMAGVEDAKRALLMQQACAGQDSTNCNAINAAIESGECTTLSVLSTLLGSAGNSNETLIVQAEGDRALEQAYTCVKITENTKDYIGSIEANAAATLVPLRATGDFNKIVVSWGLNKSGGAVDLDGTSDLPTRDPSNWPENRPALLRLQLINGGNSFHLSDFDTSGYSNTLFMRPSSNGVANSEFALDGRRGSLASEPRPAACNATTASGAYACQVTIDISPAITAGSQAAFLNVAAFYNRMDYKIELLNDGGGQTCHPANPQVVCFDGVQPEVDSTGRANDLFRRVVSRVELNNTFNYPLAALETKNNLCKNFSVTTNLDDYRSGSSECKPIDD